MNNSFTIVQKALVRAGIPLEEIRFDASLRDDLSVDSLELIEVIEIIEEGTGLTLDMQEIKSV
jgi:acyl carrier protein